jgi:uncharacterized membrane-anchored protein YhcB (DUF1043 family)
MTIAEIIAIGFVVGIALGLPIVIIGIMAIKVIKNT